MPLNQSIYIIIPVHNRKSMTIACLENLKNCGDLQKYHILVVDDGSTDGTAEVIRSQYPNVEILEGDGNLWWTGAIALGMKSAYERGATHFIWLNDDCLTGANSLNLLVDFLDRHPNSIVGAACYESESGRLVETGFKGRARVKALENEVIEVDGLSGYCVGISVTVFKQIGAPDAKKFRQYAGDGMYIYFRSG
jgi:GT2 family glycosyltransferase